MAKLQKTPLIKCQYCGDYIERKRRPNGAMAPLATFKKRKYCGVVCASNAMITRAENSDRHYKRSQLLRKDNCEVCGIPNEDHIIKSGCNLSVHHNDKDITNNDEGNIQTLCITCHNQWHWKNGDNSTPVTIKNEEGNTHGRLRVISLHPERGKTGGAMWLCECSCGNSVIVRGTDLRNGHTKSCGCIHKEGKK